MLEGKADLITLVSSRVLTEKSNWLLGRDRVLTLKVRQDATKPKVAEAVELIFGLKPSSVNLLRVCGKRKRSRRGIRVRSDWKKAYVSFGPDQDLTKVVGEAGGSE